MGIDRFIRQISVQTAVYWAAPAPDGYGGQIFLPPVEIPVRWEGRSILRISSNGEQYIAKAEVLVNQDVDVNGYLYLGTLSDFESAEGETPEAISGTYKIREFEKIPMIKSTSVFVRKAFI